MSSNTDLNAGNLMQYTDKNTSALIGQNIDEIGQIPNDAHQGHIIEQSFVDCSKISSSDAHLLSVSVKIRIQEKESKSNHLVGNISSLEIDRKDSSCPIPLVVHNELEEKQNLTLDSNDLPDIVNNTMKKNFVNDSAQLNAANKLQGVHGESPCTEQDIASSERFNGTLEFLEIGCDTRDSTALNNDLASLKVLDGSSDQSNSDSGIGVPVFSEDAEILISSDVVQKTASSYRETKIADNLCSVTNEHAKLRSLLKRGSSNKKSTKHERRVKFNQTVMVFCEDFDLPLSTNNYSSIAFEPPSAYKDKHLHFEPPDIYRDNQEKQGTGSMDSRNTLEDKVIGPTSILDVLSISNDEFDEEDFPIHYNNQPSPESNNYESDEDCRESAREVTDNGDSEPTKADDDTCIDKPDVSSKPAIPDVPEITKDTLINDPHGDSIMTIKKDGAATIQRHSSVPSNNVKSDMSQIRESSQTKHQTQRKSENQSRCFGSDQIEDGKNTVDHRPAPAQIGQIVTVTQSTIEPTQKSVTRVSVEASCNSNDASLQIQDKLAPAFHEESRTIAPSNPIQPKTPPKPVNRGCPVCHAMQQGVSTNSTPRHDIEVSRQDPSQTKISNSLATQCPIPRGIRMPCPHPSSLNRVPGNNQQIYDPRTQAIIMIRSPGHPGIRPCCEVSARQLMAQRGHIVTTGIGFNQINQANRQVVYLVRNPGVGQRSISPLSNGEVSQQLNPTTSLTLSPQTDQLSMTFTDKPSIESQSSVAQPQLNLEARQEKHQEVLFNPLANRRIVIRPVVCTDINCRLASANNLGLTARTPSNHSAASSAVDQPYIVQPIQWRREIPCESDALIHDRLHRFNQQTQLSQRNAQPRLYCVQHPLGDQSASSFGSGQRNFPNANEIRRRDGLRNLSIPMSQNRPMSISSIASSINAGAHEQQCDEINEELENFILRDQQRLERIKKRYIGSHSDDNEDPTFGFSKRPSVKGISNRSPDEIDRQVVRSACARKR